MRDTVLHCVAHMGAVRQQGGRTGNLGGSITVQMRDMRQQGCLKWEFAGEAILWAQVASMTEFQDTWPPASADQPSVA